MTGVVQQRLVPGLHVKPAPQKPLVHCERAVEPSGQVVLTMGPGTKKLSDSLSNRLSSYKSDNHWMCQAEYNKQLPHRLSPGDKLGSQDKSLQMRNQLGILDLKLLCEMKHMLIES